MAFDLFFGPDGATCSLGVTQNPPCAVVLSLTGKTTEELEEALFESFLIAEHTWGREQFKRAHTDGESGIAAAKQRLGKATIKLTTTEGKASQSNGLAEATIAIVTAIARTAATQAGVDPDDAKLWQLSAEYAESLY